MFPRVLHDTRCVLKVHGVSCVCGRVETNVAPVRLGCICVERNGDVIQHQVLGRLDVQSVRRSGNALMKRAKSNHTNQTALRWTADSTASDGVCTPHESSSRAAATYLGCDRRGGSVVVVWVAGRTLHAPACEHHHTDAAEHFTHRKHMTNNPYDETVGHCAKVSYL